MEKMYVYEAPVVEIIEVEVEQGFTLSGGGDGGNLTPGGGNE